MTEKPKRKEAKAHLEELLLEGLNSGPAVEMTSDDWADIRREVAERIEAKKQSQ